MLDVFNWFDKVPATLEFIALLAGAVTAFFVLKKAVYEPIKRHFDRVNAGMETLLGYDEVKDPGSGRVIQAATPPLALRVYDLEQTNKAIADALTTMAQNQHDLIELQREFEDRKVKGEEIVREFTEWKHHVEDRFREWVAEQDALAQIVRANQQNELE